MIYNKNQHTIFKITVSGVILGLSVALSLIEIPLPINLPGAPLEFGIIVILLVLPIIGPWWGLVITIAKPWLHILIPHHVEHGNPIIDATIVMIGGVVLILIYYALFWLFDKKLNRKNIIFRIIAILISSIFTSIFIVINVYFWAADAYGWNIIAGDHNHSHYSLIISVFAIYLPIIFSKYFISLILTIFLEKPMLNFTNRLHDKFHRYQDEKKDKNK